MPWISQRAGSVMGGGTVPETSPNDLRGQGGSRNCERALAGRYQRARPCGRASAHHGPPSTPRASV